MRVPSRLIPFLALAFSSILHAQSPSPASTPAVTIQVRNAAGATVASKSDPEHVWMTYDAAYQPGDSIVVSAPAQDRYLVIQVDERVPESMVYSPSAQVTYPLPLGKFATAYDTVAFTGTAHVISARVATPGEIATYRNVAMNAVDQRGQTQYFPHAIANAVTRDDPMYFEHNVIDGNTQNKHHGKWPYESWGNNMDPHPTLKIDFGRPITIDKVRLFIRSDFPHDTYWTNMSIQFSDGSSMPITLAKTSEPQDYSFPAKTVRWVQLADFKQVSNPPGWASITEVEVFGKDATAPQ